MRWMNTHKGYGMIARVFHILLAIMIIGQLSVGIYMVNLPNNMKASIYADHKMYGIIALVIVLFRLSWRLINVIPNLPEGTPKWQQFSARSLHRFFYVLMIAMPISGWTMSTAAGYLPTLPGLGKVAFPFFGDAGLCFIGKCFHSDAVGQVSHDIHEVFGWLFVLLLVVHTSIALWHLYLKDGIFQRIFVDRTY